MSTAKAKAADPAKVIPRGWKDTDRLVNDILLGEIMRTRVTTNEIREDLRALVSDEIRTAYRRMGKIVERAGANGSALHGLEVAAAAFAALLDTYAAPNALNPEGMCDDPAAFRRYFANIIICGAGIARGADPSAARVPSRRRAKS